MPQAPRFNLKRLSALALLCAIVLTTIVLPQSASAATLPGAGTDVLDVTGTVGVASRLGSETFAITGTATIAHGTPYMSGGAEEANLEIVDLDLLGESLVGDITITENPFTPSPGLLRGIQPPTESLPATAELNVFIHAVAPANPGESVIMYNTAPLHMVPMQGGNEVPVEVWPPHNSTFVADTTPCVPLLPTLPLEACLTSLSVTIQVPGVGGMSELTAARKTDHSIEEDPAITPIEGVLIAVAAVAGVVGITGAGWYLRRLRAER
jgi:hypothetical protein